jgi:hypothetical protein
MTTATADGEREDEVQPDTDSTPARAVTPRAIIIGLACVCAAVMLIHWAELILGGRQGHTAMANTSVPVGAFMALMAVLAVSALVRLAHRQWGLSQGEMIVAYVMAASASVLASSGAMHFLIPALAAPYYFATPENKWAEFHEFIPEWLVPQGLTRITYFFEGGEPIPWDIWLGPAAMWCGFVIIFAICSLCLSLVLRAQWVERERLTFPTTYIPLNVTESTGAFWRNKVAWIGMAIPFAVGTLNTLNLNYPAVPKIEVRNIQLAQYMRARPWNAMGGLRLSFYPFVIGIAFLLSGEITFSCWFFHLWEKAVRVMGASFGIDDLGSGGLARFPFAEHQGAGAFIGLTALSFYVGRKQFASMISTALLGGQARDEATAARWAIIGLLVCFAAMVLFAHAAGMSVWLAASIVGLSLVYLTAATRIHAETGNAWLFGPRVDPTALIMTFAGSRSIGPRDLTLTAFLANIATWDLRCVAMPHQLDGLKMAEGLSIERVPMTGAIALATVVGVPFAFWTALKIWHDIGAIAKGEVWRVNQGKAPFARAATWINAPTAPDYLSAGFVGFGLLTTIALFAMRAAFVNWPLHPVGYAIAGTRSMHAQWLPFFIAWLCKVTILRYGGPQLYRAALPFFLGLVVGDFLNGGLYTFIAFFIPTMRVYPINW